MTWIMQQPACACSNADCLTNGCRLMRERGALMQRPMGCICPPGANKDCANPACPRNPPAAPSAFGGFMKVGDAQP